MKWKTACSTRCQRQPPFVELQKASREGSIVCKHHIRCPFPHGNVPSSHTSSSTLPGARVSRESLGRHGGPPRCSSEITLVPRKLQYLRRGRRPLFSVWFTLTMTFEYVTCPPPPPSELFTGDRWQLPYFRIRTWVEWVYGAFWFSSDFFLGPLSHSIQCHGE